MIERTREREKGVDGSKASPLFINHFHSCPSVLCCGVMRGCMCVCVALIRDDAIRWKNRTEHDMTCEIMVAVGCAWTHRWERAEYLNSIDQSSLLSPPFASLSFLLLPIPFHPYLSSYRPPFSSISFSPSPSPFLYLEFYSPRLRLCLPFSFFLSFLPSS